MNPRSPFVFFSLHTHILPFTVTECVIGDALMEDGVQPILMRPLQCTCRLLEHFSAWTDGYEVQCNRCEVESGFIKECTPGWRHDVLSDYAKPGDTSVVEEHLRELTPENGQTFSFEGLPVGQIAVHDIVLEYKQDNLKFDPSSEVWRKYVSLVKGLMLSKLWMHRALDQITPRGLMVYNSNYSLNRAIGSVADLKKVPRFSMHGGASLRHVWDTLMLVRGDIFNYRIACRSNWKKGLSQNPLSVRDVRLVAEHFEELFVGKNAHAYSPPLGSSSCDDLIISVNPSNSRKVILLALSSTDERVALEQSGVNLDAEAGGDLFSTQLEWLEFFISKAKTRDDLAFIIRVHPRDFPNKRENKTSDNARRLQQFLVDLPENVVVNWPDQEISYYELLQRVDLVLSIWSSVLLEASLFGCPIIVPKNPVVAYLYDSVADEICTDVNSYWNGILKHLELGWSIDRSIRTFRWYWFIQHGGAVKLSSSDQREPGTYEKWEDLKLQSFRLMQKWAKKVRLNVPFRLKSNRMAFGGGVELSRRPVNVIGKRLILETLLGDFDPMEDFQKLQQLQSEGYEGDREADLKVVETHAVISELKCLVNYIPQSARADSSNIAVMIQKAEAAQNIK